MHALEQSTYRARRRKTIAPAQDLRFADAPRAYVLAALVRGTSTAPLHGMLPDASSPSPRRALRVLVVDDDAAARAAIACAVRSFGHTCLEASDGSEAWELLHAAHGPHAEIDVVISDWQMPGMTGIELCRHVRRAKDEAPYTYFMLMAGFEERGRLLEGMAAGADDFQRKPVEVDELEARLLSAARVVALHRRLARKTQRLRRDSGRLQVAARTDALTGLANRRQMDEDLEVARARCARYAGTCSIAICDIDHFKRLNDTLGHVAGDDALRRVAQGLRAQLRASDAVYRYGGEEFLVLFPEQSAVDAALAADRLREAVEALGIATPGGVVTISAGVAEVGATPEATREWIARADAALYEAKHTGRNRISVIPARQGRRVSSGPSSVASATGAANRSVFHRVPT